MAMKRSSNMKPSILLISVLLLAVGAIAAFQTGLVDRAFATKAPSYSRELLDMVKMSGSVKVSDLGLSSKDIHKLNVAAMKVRRAFSRIDISLNMEDKFAPVKVKRDTHLELDMVFKTDEDCEVKCWTRTVPRKRLVAHMVRAMDEAMSEYEYYQKMPGVKGQFKRLYM
ncbi:hypothetical protein [Pseudodesulfovibrio sp. zrk46]|uniref:hypothetical protein n=1 Tax=Pseudodesulfovibrio sp. zrk46 TaxID=2725288 RepID=UPI001448F6AC|nr:hypothetical protein [Pseudodesulfovibrio sp. zrk46]QJB55342.1 hypothetical protein HFN16_02570 [Pseudodesulfovibrio sp. zrk46]